MKAFAPSVGTTVNIDVSASSQNVQVSSAKGDVQIRVMNNGSATVFIKFDTQTPAATLTDSIPVGSGACEVFTVTAPAYVGVIAAGATGKVYFTPGAGI